MSIKRGAGGNILRGPGGNISRCCCSGSLPGCPDFQCNYGPVLINIYPTMTLVTPPCDDFYRHDFVGPYSLSRLSNSGLHDLLGSYFFNGDPPEDYVIFASTDGNGIIGVGMKCDGISGAQLFTCIVQSGSIVAAAVSGLSFSEACADYFSGGITFYGQPVVTDGQASRFHWVGYWQNIQLSSTYETMKHSMRCSPGLCSCNLIVQSSYPTTDSASDWTEVSPTFWEKVTDGPVVTPAFTDISNYYYWRSYYDCTCGEWGMPELRCDETNEDDEWTWYPSEGFARIRNYGVYNTVPSFPTLAAPTCYYTYTTSYDCGTSSWSAVTLSSVDVFGPSSDWQNMGGMWQKVTTTNTAPAAPSTPPVCYCDWICDYDCGSSTWGTPYMAYCYEGFGEMPWQIYGTQAYGTFSAGTTPDAPTEPGQC